MSIKAIGFVGIGLFLSFFCALGKESSPFFSTDRKEKDSLFVGKDLRERQELFLPVQGSKLDMVLNMVEHSYVDTVDIQKIEENAINEVIKDLDPHTVYIPPAKAISANVWSQQVATSPIRAMKI